jgi:hypothetical protein
VASDAIVIQPFRKAVAERFSEKDIFKHGALFPEGIEAGCPEW